MAGLITFSLELAPPGRMSLPWLVGTSVETGRSQSGIATSADLSGGGMVAVKYGSVQLANVNPVRLKYWSQLKAQLTGGTRSIIVPLLTDFFSPITRLAGSVPFSDGAYFSDGSGFATFSGSASLTADAALNAGVISMKVQGPIALTGGEWFDLFHPTKFYRAYTVSDVLSVTGPDVNGISTYNLAIRPTIREAMLAGSVCNFYRPRCMMKLEPGTQISGDVEKYWWSTPEISLSESF